MNYIGSKARLLPFIKETIKNADIDVRGKALDLFCGTAAVSKLLKTLGFQVWANDYQTYAGYVASANIMLNSYPTFDGLVSSIPLPKRLRKTPMLSISQGKKKILDPTLPCATVLSFLDQLPGYVGDFVTQYCGEGGDSRCYFSVENGKRIQAIRDQIEQWYTEKRVTVEEYRWLIASLIESADRVANTASVYGAYLKSLKKTAQAPLKVMAIEPIFSRYDVKHTVSIEDSSALVKQLQLTTSFELIYIDPPYNQRDYAANYHILETLACWDLASFKPRGKTGLRDTPKTKSQFCRKKNIQDTFAELFSLLPTKYVLFSYNNEGLLSAKEIKDLFSIHFSQTQFLRKAYSRFKSDKTHLKRQYKQTAIEEFLVLGYRE